MATEYVKKEEVINLLYEIAADQEHLGDCITADEFRNAVDRVEELDTVRL